MTSFPPFGLFRATQKRVHTALFLVSLLRGPLYLLGHQSDLPAQTKEGHEDWGCEPAQRTGLLLDALCLGPAARTWLSWACGFPQCPRSGPRSPSVPDTGLGFGLNCWWVGVQKV